jgi:hypothetical protein
VKKIGVMACSRFRGQRITNTGQPGLIACNNNSHEAGQAKILQQFPAVAMALMVILAQLDALRKYIYSLLN